MIEQELADRFSQELDAMLETGRIDDPDSVFAQDLAFAKELADADLSHQSEVRGPLAVKLAGGPKTPWSSYPAFKMAAAFCVMVLAIPVFEYIASDHQDYGTSLGEGFDSKGPLFPDGSTLYESGTEGFSPGGLMGSESNVIMPLNVRDPSALILVNRAPDSDGRLMSAEAPEPVDREGYANQPENAFHRAKEAPLSTFSIDVDAASYANVRRILNEGRLPPAGAVRVEEMINYFSYDYPEPTGKHPFSITTELAACPWNVKHKLVHIGLKGKSSEAKTLPPSNLVFLVDTSASMYEELELVKKSLALLVKELREEDRIAIVAYAGSAGLVLPATSGAEKKRILSAIDNLASGGSTAGAAGIELAYKIAAENFRKDGNNRVLLATDGDFNVGLSSDDELVRMIEKKREQGVFLTVLGFGSGNYQDAKMEQLADKGNGNYAYVDSLREANKVLVKEIGGTLVTIAKDVKIQVEFNPARVRAYRLVGYENRMLAAEDFNDDKKDAGELGAGHTVTALYEIIPVGVDTEDDPEAVDALKYQKPVGTVDSKELLTVKFRYKKPDGRKSRLLTRPVLDANARFAAGGENLRFSTAVAEFAMLLRGSDSAKNLSYEGVLEHARGALGQDPEGHRAEFLLLVETARDLDRQKD
ncbi:MAG: hypothetical protein AUJ52_13975 [Elusimicrobia bacterium CG1_02_63_36]|nr:MAG: hypothetical protein AUJ52_13975 [Elusimicrobia bacterium CG1_02_63_36]